MIFSRLKLGSPLLNTGSLDFLNVLCFFLIYTKPSVGGSDILPRLRRPGDFHKRHLSGLACPQTGALLEAWAWAGRQQLRSVVHVTGTARLLAVDLSL